MRDPIEFAEPRDEAPDELDLFHKVLENARAFTRELETIIHQYEAVIFDACGAGNKGVKDPKEKIDEWAEQAVERYLARNPECRGASRDK